MNRLPCIACIVFAATLFCRALPAAEELMETRIYCDQVIGETKPGLGGVSMGGETESYLKPEVVKALQDVGIKSVRLESITANLTLKIYDPATGKYNWTDLDREIEAIQSSGAQIIANIFYTPEWLSSDPLGKKGRAVMAAPKDYKLWAKYVGDIVRHVNRERKYKIRYWEIWNEPSGVWAFTAWPEGKDKFWKLYEVTARAIKRADPSALVGGFGDNPSYPEHIADFCDYIRVHRLPLDFLTIHWYGEWEKNGDRNPILPAYLARTSQNLVYERLRKRVPVFLTEWNRNASAPVGTQAGEEAYIVSALFWMQDSPIEQANFFRIEQYSAAQTCLLTWPDNRWREAARALSLYNRLRRQRVNTSAIADRVTVLASKDEKGVSILLSRYEVDSGVGPATQRLILSGYNRPGEYKVTMYLEDSTNADRLGKPVAQTLGVGKADGNGALTIDVPLERCSVALVTVE